MKYTHFIDIRVFSRPEDNEELLMKRVKELFPFNLENEKIKINEKTAFGFDQKKIKIISISLKKQKHTNALIKNIMQKLGQNERNLLLSQLDDRLDKRLRFYIRLDKEKLLNGEYCITDSGNCFHFTFSIAAYPHTRENALLILRHLIRD